MNDRHRSCDSVLNDLERVFQRFGFTAPPGEHARARRRALAVLSVDDGHGYPRQSARTLAVRESDVRGKAAAVAAATFAIEMLTTLAVDLAARPAECAALIKQLERVSGTPRVVLGRGALRSPGLLELGGAVAVEVQLALLLAFTEAQAVSLWTLRRSQQELTHVAHAGEFNLHALHTRRVARSLLLGKVHRSYGEGSAVGVAVERGGQTRAAVVARGARSRTIALSLLESALPVLGATLAGDTRLLAPSRRSTRRTGSAESRLTQLRFDLHDGPQQDVIMLAEDLRLLAAQLAPVVSRHPAKQRLSNRIDDLASRLVALDGDLRRIVGSLSAPFAPPDPLIDAVIALTDAFAARTGIEPSLRLEGDLTKLTESQLSVLHALLRETLANIRKHSGAESVAIWLRGDPEKVTLKVTDNGRGFNPEQELVRAAQEGHIGLAGLYERVHRVGGRAEIDSRPGGPTVISAALPTGARARARARKQGSLVGPRTGTKPASSSASAVLPGKTPRGRLRSTREPAVSR